MKYVVGTLMGTGVLVGKVVNATRSLIVWTISGAARMLIRPFSIL